MITIIEKGIEAKGYYEYRNTDDYFKDIPNEKFDFDFVLLNLSVFDFIDKHKNSVKIKADFKEDGVYPGYVTLFFYNDGKVLGTADYIDIKTTKDHITGKYYIFQSSLLLFTEWESNHSLIIIPLKETTITHFNSVFSTHKIDRPNTLTEEPKPKEKASSKTVLKTISIRQNFLTIHPDDSPNTIPKLLVMAEILRLGWSVSFTENDKIIEISRDNKTSKVILHAISLKNPKWTIKYKDGMEKMIHVFINIPKDPFENYLIYNIKGVTIQNWFKKKSSDSLVLSKDDKLFSNYEYDWNIYK